MCKRPCALVRCCTEIWRCQWHTNKQLFRLTCPGNLCPQQLKCQARDFPSQRGCFHYGGTKTYCIMQTPTRQLCTNRVHKQSIGKQKIIRFWFVEVSETLMRGGSAFHGCLCYLTFCRHVEKIKLQKHGQLKTNVLITDKWDDPSSTCREKFKTEKYSLFPPPPPSRWKSAKWKKGTSESFLMGCSMFSCTGMCHLFILHAY